MIRKQSGALLLLVALLLATLAALSFGLNRAAGADAMSVQSDYESRAAGYLAEAGVAAAKWVAQANACKVKDIPITTFGGGKFHATVTKAPSRRLNIIATGTVGDDAARTIKRDEMNSVDLTKTTTTTYVSAGAIDTTITSGITGADAGNAALSLASGTKHALLYWALSEISADTTVVSAWLTLTLDGSTSAARPVAVHRMMTQWDANATWYRPRMGYAWTGGDYTTGAVTSTSVTENDPYLWDVTALVDGWVSGRLANYGMLMRLSNAGQTAKFYSRDTSSGPLPVLRVITMKAC